MENIARGARTISYVTFGFRLHMVTPELVDQQELIYIGSVRTLDVV